VKGAARRIEVAAPLDALAADDLPGGGQAGRLLMEAGLRRLEDSGYLQVALWVAETNERAGRFDGAGGWRADGSARWTDPEAFPLVESVSGIAAATLEN
jgi:hypothetical protein